MSMNATRQQPVNFKALAWTIVVHVLLFLLFVLVRYAVPTVYPPPLPELGMEVNLGASPDGSGTDQPMSMEDPAADVSATNSVAASGAIQQNEVLQSNDPDAPVITPANTTITSSKATNNTTARANNTSTNTTTNNTTQQQRPKYVYNGGTGKGGNSAAQDAPGTSEGNTTGNGDRGVPGGTPGAPNYEGSPGNGTGGVSHTLGKRTISPAKFEAEFNESGKVVIRVTVDKDGNIVDKRIKSSPSHRLSQLALQKLGQARFSKSDDAAPQQFGEITIVFKTRS
ncbi:MAG: hypothetical protein EOP56_03760 [Sphingobacteriales bacterium]|nr:MAG: hypothetical protein EOP56_03760 [Sphingobacteriales bacterium]